MSMFSPTTNIAPGLAKLHRPDVRVHGAWLIVARIVWAVVALFDLCLLVITYPMFVAQLGVVCPDPAKGTCGSLQLSPANFAALQHFHLPVEGYMLYALVADLFVTLLFLVIGALLFWYRSADRMGLFVSLLFITVGSFGIDEVHIQAFQNPPLAIEIFGTPLVFLQWPALGMLFYTFPDGRFVPRWSWLLAFLFLIQVGFYFLPYPYNFDNWPLLLSLLEFLLVWGSAVGTQLYRYIWVSSPTQQQQAKWLTFGFALGVLLTAISQLLPLAFPALNATDSLYPLIANQITTPLVYLTIPLSIGIALLRYRLWDIDLIIKRTLVYGLLTLTLALVYGVLIILVQRLFSGVIAQENPLVLVGSTLVIAALFQPLRRGIQRLIDRRFYRRKYDAARTLEAFSSTLRREVDLDQLREELLAMVQETMQPSQVSLWLRPTPRDRKPQATWSSTPPAP
jgi:hypothetical protein